MLKVQIFKIGKFIQKYDSLQVEKNNLGWFISLPKWLSQTLFKGN